MSSVSKTVNNTPMYDYSGILDKKFTTKSGKDVKDTQMLSGEAHNSLTGTNSTVQDMRSGAGTGGKTGGNDGSSSGKNKG